MQRSDQIERGAAAPTRWAGPRSAILGVLLMLLLGCGAGSTDLASGGMSGTGISSGPITGFGSIYVTNVQWKIAGASVLIDGAPGSASELDVGMVVRVQGDFDAGGATATAISVVADDAIEGPIDAAPTSPGPGLIQFTIFGQTVEAEDGVTVFADGATFDGLMADDVVEVHGVVDQGGTIVATRIALRGALMLPQHVELRGAVSALTPSQFTLGGIVTIELVPGTTTFRDGITSWNDLQDGQLVEVEGQLVNPNQIEAGVIELESNGIGVDDIGELKLRGFVSGFVSTADFQVSGVPVDASGATFLPAPLEGSIGNGDYVEVEGRLSSGTLIADEVEDETLDDQDGDLIRIEAAVPTGGIGSNALTMLGGVDVQVPATTIFADDRDGVPGFGFEDIAEGDWLEIRGAEGAANSVVTTKITRSAQGDDVVFQGPVTLAAEPDLDILGQPIDREDLGVQYEDENDMVLAPGAFFGAIAVGDYVKAKDSSAADPAQLVADEIEIEMLMP